MADCFPNSDHFLDLMCMEASGNRRATNDRHLLEDERVFQNMLVAEERYLPNSAYFSFQTEVKPYMRRLITFWMLDVCKDQGCEKEVFSLSASYVDRFLTIMNIKKTEFQLMSAACIFIASKLKDINPVPADVLVGLTEYSITLHELLDWELFVLQVLKWEVSTVTPHDILHYLVDRLKLDKISAEKIQQYSSSLIDLAMTELELAAFPPSMLGAACVGLAVAKLDNFRDSDRNKIMLQLQEMTSTDADCLRACQDRLEQLVKTNKSGEIADNKSCGCNSEQTLTPTDVMDVVVI